MSLNSNLTIANFLNEFANKCIVIDKEKRKTHTISSMIVKVKSVPGKNNRKNILTSPLPVNFLSFSLERENRITRRGDYHVL
jgi:hypothetical protein